MDANQQTVSGGDITVTKRLDSNRFNTPAVILDITSTTDRSTSVTVAEPVPEEFSSENIGFHPGFGSEHWSVSEDQIVFNRTLEPEGEYTTVYGLRNVTNEEISRFLNGETVVSTGDGIDIAIEDTTDGDTADAPVEGLLAERDDDAVRGVIAGRNDSVVDSQEKDGQEDIEVEDVEEISASEVEDIEVEHVEEETEEGELEDVAEETEEDTEEVEYVSVESEASDLEDVEIGEFGDEYDRLPNSVAEALAGEIRDGSITAENERILREAFSEPEATQRNVDVRIKRLQTQVADLTAYMDEFERILEGESDGFFESFEATLTDLSRRVESLEDSVDTVNERLAEVESGLETVRDDLESFEGQSEEIDALETRVENVEMEVEDVLYLEEDVMELNDRTDVVQRLSETVEKLDAEMEEMKAFRDRLSSAFGPDGDRLEGRTE